MGRFIGIDPASRDLKDLRSFTNPQGWNTYSYGINNPLRYTDPNGENWREFLKNQWEISLMTLDAMPGTGDVSDVYAAYTGTTLFAREKLSQEDLDLTKAAATIPILTGGQARLAKKMAQKADDAIQAGQKMLRNDGGKLYEKIEKVSTEVINKSERIAGEGPELAIFRDAKDLAKQHGGEAKDWFKMTSRDVFTDPKKGRYQIHYDMNAKTGKIVNPKKKFIDIK